MRKQRAGELEVVENLRDVIGTNIADFLNMAKAVSKSCSMFSRNGVDHFGPLSGVMQHYRASKFERKFFILIPDLCSASCIT